MIYEMLCKKICHDFVQYFRPIVLRSIKMDSFVMFKVACSVFYHCELALKLVISQPVIWYKHEIWELPASLAISSVLSPAFGDGTKRHLWDHFYDNYNCTA